MTERPSAPRLRVTWDPGDPQRKRGAWLREAVMACGQKAGAARLATVLVDLFHAGHGHAWATDAELMAQLGITATAIERHLKALESLGWIERETSAVQADGGQIRKRRRIYPTRPGVAAPTPTPVRPTPTPRAARISRPPPPQVIDISIPHPPKAPSPTPGWGCNQDLEDHRRQGEGSRHVAPGEVWGMEADSVTLGFVWRVADAIAHDVPPDAADQILALGRSVWPAVRSGALPPIALSIVADAARRAWVDDHPKVAGMVARLSELRAA